MFKPEAYMDELLRLRRWLHRHPELSMEERETSGFIHAYLSGLGMDCRRTGGTGVIGTILTDPAYKTVAVRAEIDALPIQEETGLPFCSMHPGRMHACGHDCITAVALCLAKALMENRDQLRCNVRFLFEPGEETGQGARYIMEHGGLENPQVDEILVFHYGNQESRSMEIQKNITTAAIGGITIQVRGKSSHWFQPQAGRTPFYAVSRLAVEIHELNGTLKTARPFVLGFGLMQAGSAGNIVADTATLTGSLRAFSMEDFQFVWGELEKKIRAVESETGTEIELIRTKMIPPMCNDSNLVERGAALGRELMGARFALGEEPFLVGDNAAYYTEKVPGMRTVFLAGKADEPAYPVHNPKFDIDEAGLGDALAFLYGMLTV